jgi:molybdate transport system substrate-binding protein
MTVVTLFSGLAVQEPVERVVLPLFREQYGAEVETTFEPTTVLVDLLRSGRRPDVVIAVRETLADLVREGFVAGESVNPLVRAGLGIAVRAGAHSPQVNTLPEFVSLLLSARSVAYSRAGASGIYFSGLLDRLGIGDQVNRTATVIPKGYTGECLLDGRADVAIQQLLSSASSPGSRSSDRSHQRSSATRPLPQRAWLRTATTGAPKSWRVPCEQCSPAGKHARPISKPGWNLSTPCEYSVKKVVHWAL